jgi:hypothetical protein
MRNSRVCSFAPWLLCTAPVEWDNGKKFGDTICLWQRKDLLHRVGDPRRALEKKHSFTSPMMNANSSIKPPKSNAEV